MVTNFKIFEMYYGNGYYINNCNTANQIMAIKPGDNPNNIYTNEEIEKKNIQYLIDYIKRNTDKKITFGNKTNATSVKINKEIFDILVSEFPMKSNI